MGDIIHLDFETFSAADLIELGAYRYASDKSTQILMAAVAVNAEDPVIWVHPDHESDLVQSDPRAEEIMAMWEDPAVSVYAHNAQFETALSLYRMEKDIGVVPPRIEQWRCTQTMARRAAIPSSLAKCSEYLELDFQKDKKGLALIKKFSIPQKITKKQLKSRIMGTDDPEAFAEFTEYCLQDVRTEQAVHEKLKLFEFRGAQLDAFIFDAKLNQRGIPVNRKALLNAQKIIVEVLDELGGRFQELTGFTHKQNVKVAQWFKARGYPGKGMGADEIEKAMKTVEKWAKNRKTVEALEVRQALGFAAVGKVSKMLECDCGDGWVRGCFMFYGAGTGRWSAKLIQPQNFKRPSEHLKKHTHDAFKLIEKGVTRDELEIYFGNPLDVISSSIRHFIQWQEGMMLDADYASIEARIVCWLAGQEDALVRFRANVDSYVHMAQKIFPDVKKIDKDGIERFVGKQSVLGCGFGMGAPKFQATCEKYGQTLDMEICEAAIDAYRKTYNLVAKLWKECERAARNAILHPGRIFKAGPKLSFSVTSTAGKTFLVMKLPSGRSLVYPEPKIEAGGKFGDQITFFGQIPMKSIWGRVSTYGGKLVENATQATAFDLMSNGAVRADREGFELVALIHDEALALETPGKTLEGFTAALTTLPKWAEGLPLVAEGSVVPYYKK